MWYNDFDELVGKKILALYRNDDKLIFETDSGIFAYISVGDCCSYSWFEHISGVDNLVGHTVNSILDHYTDEFCPPEVEDDPLRDQYIRVYGWRFSTDKGYFEIEMRNESNGYYGGYIVKANYDETDRKYKLIEDF